MSQSNSTPDPVEQERGTRRRKLYSCEGCRRRKTKCDHQRECSGCRMRGEECKWKVPPPTTHQDQTPWVKTSTRTQHAALRSVTLQLAGRLGVSESELDAMVQKELQKDQGSASTVDRYAESYMPARTPQHQAQQIEMPHSFSYSQMPKPPQTPKATTPSHGFSMPTVPDNRPIPFGMADPFFQVRGPPPSQNNDMRYHSDPLQLFTHL